MREDPWRSKTSPLRQAMEGICLRSHGEGTTIVCIFEELRERGFLLGLLLLVLPFVSPLPTMGLSAPVGITVLLGHGVGLGAWGYLYAVGDVTWAVIHKIISLV